MSNLSKESVAEIERVLARIRRLLSEHSAPVVVAFDGGSGAGKSTLASLIMRELDVALIPLDDFFSNDIRDSQWDEFSVEERLDRVFDFRRVRDEAIEPLRNGKLARWHAFDFQSGLRPDGTYGMRAEAIERTPAEVVLIEGAYSAHPILADMIDLAVLVDVPVEVRHARLAAREDKHFLVGWHRRWDAVESYYFTQVRPRSSFDLVLTGAQEV